MCALFTGQASNKRERRLNIWVEDRTLLPGGQEPTKADMGPRLSRQREGGSCTTYSGREEMRVGWGLLLENGDDGTAPVLAEIVL